MDGLLEAQCWSPGRAKSACLHHQIRGPTTFFGLNFLAKNYVGGKSMLNFSFDWTLPRIRQTERKY